MLYTPMVEKIIKRRKEKGLSQQKLSLQAGLGNCAINRMETGKSTQVHSHRAVSIAHTLDCQVSDIFTEVRK